MWPACFTVFLWWSIGIMLIIHFPIFPPQKYKHSSKNKDDIWFLKNLTWQVLVSFTSRAPGNWIQATNHSFQSYLMCIREVPGLCSARWAEPWTRQTHSCAPPIQDRWASNCKTLWNALKGEWLVPCECVGWAMAGLESLPRSKASAGI